MAGTIRGLFRLNVGLTKNLLSKNPLCGIRFIYTDKSLGINGYENSRLTYRNQFMNVESAFRSKMQDICKDEKNMIFTEDLKAMLHLAQKKEEDLELILNMIEKYNSQNNEMRFGTYIFGPVVMRMLYYLDEPDLALSIFKNPKLESFFDQPGSYQILLSLLYKHSKYADMRDVYDQIKSKHIEGQQHPRNALILVLASCYREDTPETLKYALDLWKEVTAQGIHFQRRGITFICGLAINQNAAYIATEILSTIREPRYIDIRCLKVLAYAKMDKFMEIIPIFRSSLEYDRPHTRKEFYFSDVIEFLEERMKNAEFAGSEEVHKLIHQLRVQDCIVTTQTLTQHLCMPIDTVPRAWVRQNATQSQANQNDRYRQNRFKTGLRDLL